MYASLELIKDGTELCQEAGKSPKLAHRRYKKEYDRRVRLVPILRFGNYVFLDRPALFRSAVDRYASEANNKLLPPNEAKTG